MTKGRILASGYMRPPMLPTSHRKPKSKRSDGKVVKLERKERVPPPKPKGGRR